MISFRGLRNIKRVIPQTVVRRRTLSNQRKVHIKCLSSGSSNEVDQRILPVQLVGNVTQSRSINLSSTLFSDIAEVEVPAFAESITEGDLTWLKAVGDSVNADEVVAEVETDKTTVTIHAPFSGVIVELLVEDGATVSPGKKAFKIKPGEGGAPPPKAEAPKPEASQPSSEPSAPSAPPTPPTVVSTPDIKPIPTQRPETPPPPKQPLMKTAIAAVQHKAFQEVPQVKMPPQDYAKEITGTRTEQRQKMSRMRMRTAERLKQSQNTNAMLTTFNEIDMGSIMDLRKSVGELFLKKHGIKLGFMSAFLKASAYALQDQPVVNAVIDGNEIVYRDFVDISVAVASPKGLVVPVVRNVESMNYMDIEKKLVEFGKQAREGSLAIEDMDGGTFTISNGGVFGSMFGTPIINPPQSAILGMHGIFDRPVAINKQVVIRPMMYVALTYDHRIIDGSEAVTFLKKIKQGVEDPRIMLCGL